MVAAAAHARYFYKPRVISPRAYVEHISVLVYYRLNVHAHKHGRFLALRYVYHQLVRIHPCDHGGGHICVFLKLPFSLLRPFEPYVLACFQAGVLQQLLRAVTGAAIHLYDVYYQKEICQLCRRQKHCAKRY